MTQNMRTQPTSLSCIPTSRPAGLFQQRAAGRRERLAATEPTAICFVKMTRKGEVSSKVFQTERDQQSQLFDICTHDEAMTETFHPYVCVCMW